MMIATIQHGRKDSTPGFGLFANSKGALVMDALTGNTIYEKKCWYRLSDCVN